MGCTYIIIKLPDGGELKIPTDIEDESKASMSSIETALKAWGRDYTVKSEQISNILNKVNVEITPDYFKNIGVLGIVNKTSIKNEIQSLYTKIAELENNAIDSIIPLNVLKALDIMHTKQERLTNTLVAINHLSKENNTIVVRSVEGKTPKPEFWFYQNNNPLSLFLVAIKSKFAKHIRLEDLTTVLTAYNTTLKGVSKNAINLEGLDVKDFFLGKMTKDSFEDGQMYKLFNTIEGRKTLNTLVSLVGTGSEDIQGIGRMQGSEFRSISKQLFAALDPKKYGVPIFTEQTLLSNEYDRNNIVNLKAKQLLDVQEHIVYNDTLVRNFYYNPKEKFEVSGKQDLILETLNFLNSNIRLGVDIIKLPEKGKYKEGKWIIPTSIEADAGGIKVVGRTLDGESNIELAFDTIKVKKDNLSVEYRKFEAKDIVEADLTDLTPEEKINGNIVSNEAGLSKQVVQRYIERGSFIKYTTSRGTKYDGYVLAVYPGVIILNTKFNGAHNKIYDFNTITSVRSSKINDIDFQPLDVATLKNFQNISNGSGKLANIGDIIQISHKNKKVYNKVIDSDIDNVYILINYSDGLKIEGIKRSEILSVFIDKNTMNITEGEEIVNIHNKLLRGNSIRENNLSSFDDLNLLQNNDYAVIKNGNKYNVYKIIDKVSGRVVEATGGIVGLTSILDFNNEDLKFYTARKISSPYALNTVTTNNWTLEESFFAEPVEGEIVSNKVEVAYLLPNEKLGMLNNLQVLNYNIPNMGVVVEKIFSTTEKYSNYTNITDLVLKQIKEKTGKDIKRILVTKDKNGIIPRQTKGLFTVNGFKKLGYKKKLEYLNKGAYVKLRLNGNVNEKIYRINNLSDTNAILEYNVYSYNGELLTEFKTIPLSVLLNNDGDNSIFEYYWIVGNSKIDTFSKEYKKENSKEKPTSRKVVMEEFVEHLQNVFAKYKMEVIIDENGSNFKPNEYAKIEGW